MMKNAFLFRRVLLVFSLLMLMNLAGAQATSSTIDLSNPASASCSDDIVGFTCKMMKALLYMGPMVAIISLVLGAVIYVYANVFVTAEQRGRYHSLATSLVLGALILAAICGGAGVLTGTGMKFLQTSS